MAPVHGGRPEQDVRRAVYGRALAVSPRVPIGPPGRDGLPAAQPLLAARPDGCIRLPQGFGGALIVCAGRCGAAQGIAERNGAGCDDVYEVMRNVICRTAVLMGWLAMPVIAGQGMPLQRVGGCEGAHPETIKRSLTVLVTAVVGLLATGLLAGCGESAGPAPSLPAATPSPSRPAVTSPSSAPSTGDPAGFEPAAVSFVSPSRGWVLGRSGCSDCAGLLRTRDGGVHWTALPAPPAPLGYYSRSANAVTDVAFAGDANGFLYGPGLLATHNGGRSWARQPLPSVQAVRVGAGYAYALTRYDGSAGLWRTAIGASRWAQLQVPPGAGRPVSSGYGTQLYAEGSTLVLLRSGFTGPAVTPGPVGQLWVSSDSGTTWQARPVPSEPPKAAAPQSSASLLATRTPGCLTASTTSNPPSSKTPSTTCTAPPMPGCPGPTCPTPPGITCPACSPTTAPGTPSSPPKAPSTPSWDPRRRPALAHGSARRRIVLRLGRPALREH